MTKRLFYTILGLMIALCIATFSLGFAQILRPRTRNLPPPPRDPYYRALYLDAESALDTAQFNAALKLAEASELNVVWLHVKDRNGTWYDTRYRLFDKARTATVDTTFSLSAHVNSAHLRGTRVSALITVARDRGMPEIRPEWAVKTTGGEVWKADGIAWLSITEPGVCEAHLRLAKEAEASGVTEVIFDVLRFPLNRSDLPDQVHPRSTDEPPYSTLSACLERARQVLGIPVGVLIDGWVVDDLSANPQHGDLFEMLLLSAEHIYVEIYPSETGYPENAAQAALGLLMRLKARMVVAERYSRSRAEVRPVLQAFTARSHIHHVYFSAELRSQVDAAYSLGFQNWVALNPRGDYGRFSEAFQKRQNSGYRPGGPLLSDALLSWAQRAPRLDSVATRLQRFR